MTEREIYEEIVRQNGACCGIICKDCPYNIEHEFCCYGKADFENCKIESICRLKEMDEKQQKQSKNCEYIGEVVAEEFEGDIDGNHVSHITIRSDQHIPFAMMDKVVVMAVTIPEEENS